MIEAWLASDLAPACALVMVLWAAANDRSKFVAFILTIFVTPIGYLLLLYINDWTETFNKVEDDEE